MDVVGPFVSHTCTSDPQEIKNSLEICYWKKGKAEAWGQPKRKHIFQVEIPQGSGDFSHPGLES